MVARKRVPAVTTMIETLLSAERFGVVVCDFLTPVVNLPLNQAFILFEHNVETIIWRRYAAGAANLVRRAFFRSQTDRMLAFERAACRRAAHVITVSEADAKLLGEMCGISHVSSVPTGVDVEYFCRRTPADASNPGLVFAGSMDWMPNIDAVLWFVREVLPLIRRQIPQCSLTIAGRRPAAEIRALADDPLIRVTGTVDDIRPFLWGGKVSVVPLRIGSGTRLKIYEAMAAETPVVTTTIGAEGLDVSSPQNIRIADTPEAFANACVDLLTDPEARARQTAAALRLVRERFSWEKVAACFEETLAKYSGTASTGESAPLHLHESDG